MLKVQGFAEYVRAKQCQSSIFENAKLVFLRPFPHLDNVVERVQVVCPQPKPCDGSIAWKCTK